MDTRENCWRCFIDKVRRSLKVVLCMSPVGSTLRVRARKFPALVNGTSIDWHVTGKLAIYPSIQSILHMNHVIKLLSYKVQIARSLCMY